MSRRRFSDMNCAIARALDQVGDWWTLLIIREAFYGSTTFSAFQKRLGVARNILTDRLNQLVETGVMTRRAVRPGTDRHVYELTGKGRDLLPALVALMQWGERWALGDGGPPVELVEAETATPVAPMEVRLMDGRPLNPEALDFRPGPGADASVLERLRAAEAERRTA